MKIYILLGLFIMNACSETVQPPKANKKPHKMMMHGHHRIDDYYWMRLDDEQKSKEPYDQRTQEVVDYINAENYYLKKDQNVVQGNDAGFIKFGSRVDLFLPLGTKLDVKLNQKVRGGETVIAKL